MKNFVLCLALTVAGSTALADYFYCKITSGFNHQEAEAEYGVRQASVTMRPFTCEGRVVPGTRLIEAKIISTETGDYQLVQVAGTATISMYGLDIHGDGLDEGECTCGVR